MNQLGMIQKAMFQKIQKSIHMSNSNLISLNIPTGEVEQAKQLYAQANAILLPIPI